MCETDQLVRNKRDFVRNHKKLAVTVLVTSLVLTPFLWLVSASARGQIVARFDAAHGYYEVLGYGLPSPRRTEYVRLLRQRYGIQFRTVAFCTVSRPIVAYADGYNSVSIAAANRKFGHDVFKECAEDAKKSWERIHAKSQNSTE
jgi:hypothetical protein